MESKISKFLRVIFLIIAAAYFFTCVRNREGFYFFNNVNLPIHEAGHALFSFFGYFMTIAGGTIMQLIVPLIFAIYFLKRGDQYSAAFVLFWLGQSFTDVARYAGDAFATALPLLGDGGAESHDWHNMLALTNSLDKTYLISDFFYYTGASAIIVGIILGVLSFFKKTNSGLTVNNKYAR